MNDLHQSGRFDVFDSSFVGYEILNLQNAPIYCYDTAFQASDCASRNLMPLGVFRSYSDNLGSVVFCRLAPNDLF